MSAKRRVPAAFCPTCFSGDQVAPDPKCKTCKGEGVIGDSTRCSKAIPICWGGVFNYPWECTCDGGISEALDRRIDARQEAELRHLSKELLKRLTQTERMLWSCLQEDTARTATRLALEAVSSSIPAIEARYAGALTGDDCPRRFEGAMVAVNLIRQRLTSALEKDLLADPSVTVRPTYVAPTDRFCAFEFEEATCDEHIIVDPIPHRPTVASRRAARQLELFV
ncbi:MAG: hypothetical protein AAFV53_27140 [Myxococcota bacterium]